MTDTARPKQKIKDAIESQRKADKASGARSVLGGSTRSDAEQRRLRVRLGDNTYYRQNSQ